MAVGRKSLQWGDLQTQEFTPSWSEFTSLEGLGWGQRGDPSCLF